MEWRLFIFAAAEVQEIGYCQEVCTAAGGKITFYHFCIKAAYFVYAGRTGDKLAGAGICPLESAGAAAGDDIRVRNTAKQRQKCINAALLQAFSCGKRCAQSGESEFFDAWQSIFYFAAYAGETVLPVYTLTGGRAGHVRHVFNDLTAHKERALGQYSVHVAAETGDGPQPPHGAAHRAEREDSPLVGVHAVRCGEHGVLRFPPLAAQQREAVLRAERGVILSDGSGALKIRYERGSARHERENVHIAVTAGIGAVDETGLRRGAHLVEQRAHRLRGDELRVGSLEEAADEKPCLCLQRGYRVQAARGASAADRPADDAAARLKTELRPVELSALRVYNVHVEETAHLVLVLYPGAQRLYPHGVAVNGYKRLAAGGSVGVLLVQYGKPRVPEFTVQPGQTFVKAAAERRPVLNRACDVERIGDDRARKVGDKLLLLRRARLTRGKNGGERDFYLLHSVTSSNSVSLRFLRSCGQ